MVLGIVLSLETVDARLKGDFHAYSTEISPAAGGWPLRRNPHRAAAPSSSFAGIVATTYLSKRSFNGGCGGVHGVLEHGMECRAIERYDARDKPVFRLHPDEPFDRSIGRVERGELQNLARQTHGNRCDHTGGADFRERQNNSA